MLARAIFLIWIGGAQATPAAPMVQAGDPGLRARGGLLLYHGRRFSGRVVERWLGGAIYKDTAYAHGLQEGAARMFALNGRLIQEWNFRAGKKDGVQRGWFEEGPRKFEMRYARGLLDGEQIEWHMNGRVFRRQVFRRGVEVKNKVLYPGGEIFTNYARRGGRLYGMDGGTLCQAPAKLDGEK